ncbi:hypothetical protein CBR_g39470 [Chara braunii]|uniref:Uncharacterized protein n=1 Tax=Chara braunii TaxID=69332 RepID=A0A388LRQ0_CHABU|nr:hypothetical protein CBR_g39470 [Chara braunii]|eukprot:GBG85006.1 hypothetical protein CBR_g39470 [Chara braunii]
MAGKKVVDANEEVSSLKKEVKKLRLQARSSGVEIKGGGVRSTGNDEAIACIMHEHEEMKAKVEQVAGTAGRIQLLEEEIKLLKQMREEALQEAQVWKKEALRPGNKRGCIAMTPDSKLKSHLPTTPAKSIARPAGNPMELTQLHRLEVASLKELRLQELNRRREAEQELDKAKEAIARMEAEKTRQTSCSNLRERMEEAAGCTVQRTGKGKKKVTVGPAGAKENDREGFIKEARREFRNLKKDDVMEICAREGVKYTTLQETIDDIIGRRVELAFGDPKDKGKIAHVEISDDLVDDRVDGQDVNDGRDSVSS